MLKNEQTTIVCTQCDRWTSYDLLKHQQPLMLYQNSSKGFSVYFQFKTITFPGQNRKVFIRWRVVSA